MTLLLVSTGLIVWGFVCAINDMRKKQINNKLTFGLFAIALAYLLVTGNTLMQSSAEQAVIGLIYAIALSLPGYIMGRMGAADVKMLCAIAIATNSTYVLTCFIGAAISIVIWAVSKPLWLKLPHSLKEAVPFMDPSAGKALPYAPFLFIGMLLATV